MRVMRVMRAMHGMCVMCVICAMRAMHGMCVTRVMCSGSAGVGGMNWTGPRWWVCMCMCMCWGGWVGGAQPQPQWYTDVVCLGAFGGRAWLWMRWKLVVSW